MLEFFGTQNDQTSVKEPAATKADSCITSGHFFLSAVKARCRCLFCTCVGGDKFAYHQVEVVCTHHPKGNWKTQVCGNTNCSYTKAAYVNTTVSINVADSSGEHGKNKSNEAKEVK